VARLPARSILATSFLRRSAASVPGPDRVDVHYLRFFPWRFHAPCTERCHSAVAGKIPLVPVRHGQDVAGAIIVSGWGCYVFRAAFGQRRTDDRRVRRGLRPNRPLAGHRISDAATIRALFAASRHGLHGTCRRQYRHLPRSLWRTRLGGASRRMDLRLVVWPKFRAALNSILVSRNDGPVWRNTQTLASVKNVVSLATLT